MFAFSSSYILLLLARSVQGVSGSCLSVAGEMNVFLFLTFYNIGLNPLIQHLQFTERKSGLVRIWIHLEKKYSGNIQFYSLLLSLLLLLLLFCRNGYAGWCVQRWQGERTCNGHILHWFGLRIDRCVKRKSFQKSLCVGKKEISAKLLYTFHLHTFSLRCI